NKIIIIDDAVSKDNFLKKVMLMAAPRNIEVEVYGEEDEDIQKIANSIKEDDKIIILVKIPEVLEKMLNNNFKFTEVILGGMGSKPGRKNLFRNISVSKEEVDSFKRLMDKGVNIKIRIVPDDKAINITETLKKYE